MMIIIITMMIIRIMIMLIHPTYPNYFNGTRDFWPSPYPIGFTEPSILKFFCSHF